MQPEGWGTLQGTTESSSSLQIESQQVLEMSPFTNRDLV